MSYSGPVQSLSDIDTVEGLRRAAKEARAKRQTAPYAGQPLITWVELKRDIIVPIIVPIGATAIACGIVYLLLRGLAWLAALGVLPIK